MVAGQDLLGAWLPSLDTVSRSCATAFVRARPMRSWVRPQTTSASLPATSSPSPGPATSLELLLKLAARLRISDQRRKVPADSPGYSRFAEAAVGPRRSTRRDKPRIERHQSSRAGLPNNH